MRLRSNASHATFSLSSHNKSYARNLSARILSGVYLVRCIYLVRYTTILSCTSRASQMSRQLIEVSKLSHVRALRQST